MTLVAAATIALARLAPAARAAARAAAPVKHLAAMWLAQRDLNRLAGLSDRDLSDVGITPICACEKWSGVAMVSGTEPDSPPCQITKPE